MGFAGDQANALQEDLYKRAAAKGHPQATFLLSMKHFGRAYDKSTALSEAEREASEHFPAQLPCSVHVLVTFYAMLPAMFVRETGAVKTRWLMKQLYMYLTVLHRPSQPRPWRC